MKKAVPFLSLIAGVVLLVIALVLPSSSDDNNFTRMLKMLPEDIGEFIFIDTAMLQDDEEMASRWNSIKENALGEGIYGENVSKITGFGMAGSQYELLVYAGDFDLEQMTSMIEQGSLESFEYEGVTVWTDQYASSTAVIDDIVFIGSSEDIQLCIDVAGGQGSSLYDNKDAKDAIGRLPGGYMLGVVVMGGADSSVDDYGILAVGMAASRDGRNISETSLLKFEDSDAAQEYVTLYGSQIPEYYDIDQEGEYVTVVATSEMPSPEEEAYNSAYDDIQNAVAMYYYANEGAFPTTNGTVNISGYDLNILDICALLTSSGGTLSEVPQGVTSVEGSDNDNCDTGCGGCSAASHYIWAINNYGIFSVCVGSNCSEYNSDGFQGVWP